MASSLVLITLWWVIEIPRVAMCRVCRMASGRCLARPPMSAADPSKTPPPPAEAAEHLTPKRALARHPLLRQWRRNLAFWLGALLVGLVALAFAHLADLASATFRGVVAHSQWWPWLVCPLGFAALVWLTQGALKNTRGSGIPQVIVALEQRSSPARNALLSVRIAVGKLVMTLLALLVGASAGREGPTVHIGAALMYSFGRRLGLYEKHTVSGLTLPGARRASRQRSIRRWVGWCSPSRS